VTSIEVHPTSGSESPGPRPATDHDGIRHDAGHGDPLLTRRAGGESDNRFALCNNTTSPKRSAGISRVGDVDTGRT
ncbi:MAG TPA: hypothetical protein PLI18_16220, partial [Pirellulaceae bacterium]|nr:hypothetical protein [Pirellulaceae bacterium]